MRRAGVWLCLAAILSWPDAFGQIGTSTLTGRVTDSTGAVVPAVKVLVVNTETNFRFTATTKEEGLFRIQSLQPGPYRLTFEAAGFKRLVRENITLRMGDTLPVDAVLEVGSMVESIEVTAAAQLLETETSATGTAVAGKVLYNLPIYQRSLDATFLFVPGMTAQGYANASNLGQFHVAGQRSSAIAYFEDGVTGNDQGSGTATVWTVQNAVAEVKVLTTTLPAEYGHSAGGVLSIVKKTGTNEVHGMISEYGRSRRMEHRNFFQKPRSSDPQPGAPNGLPVFFMQPDTNFGGPIVLPKIYNGRNKSFFFFGYQKLIIKTSKQFFATTPTPEMKAGDFSFGGLGNPIFDPTTTRLLPNGSWARDPIPNTQIPLSRFDPVARKILAIDPWKPPVAGYGTFNSNGPVDNQPYMEYAQVFYEQYSGRVDHQFSPNFKIYGSYSYDHYAPDRRPSNIRNEDFSNQYALGTTTSQNYSIGKTLILSPTVFNDARIGYYRRRSDRFLPSQGKNYGQILGIPNISPDQIPNFGSGGNFSPDSIYSLTVTGPSRSIGETISFRDDLTKIHGTHAFKAGYEVLRIRVNSRSEQYPSGSFSFSGMTAGLQTSGNVAPRTGNTFAGFLLGSVAQAQFTKGLAAWLPRESINSFYFQDDWKVSPTLTLNLGIRYSTESPYQTKYNQTSNFDPRAIDDLTGRVGAIVHPSSGLNRRDTNNFQPRVGAAWHPWKRWVFRGGFAVNTVDVKYPLSAGQSDEYTALANQQRPPGDPRPIYQISQGPDPVVFSIRPNGTSAFVGTNYSARSVAGWDPNLRNPYVLNGSLSTQYEINANYVLEVAYQWSSGVGLVERWQANTFPTDFGKNDPALQLAAFRTPQDYRPYPQFGDVLVLSNFGHSTYHSGTVKVEKRYSRGLSFLNFYTFSKAIDSQDSDTSGSGVAPIQNRSLEKGRATYDRAHRFVGNVTYELPLGKGKPFINRGGLWDRVFGGFEINWVQTFESGNPLTFSFANSPYNYFPTFAGNLRPNVVGKPALRDNWQDLGGDRFNSQNINPIIDINSFAYPAAFTPGNAGRNIVTGTPLIFSQFSAKKNIKISERFRFQVRLDYYNALKHFNFDPPTTTVDLLNPRTFAKLTSSPSTAPFGGIPLMNLALQLSW